MKIWSTILSAVLALTLTLAGTTADAKRLGGGTSFGKQSSNVTKREAAPGGANSAANSAAKPATPAADRKSTRLNSSHIQKSRMPSSA